jgi:hypothetical protein
MTAADQVKQSNAANAAFFWGDKELTGVTKRKPALKVRRTLGVLKPIISRASKRSKAVTPEPASRPSNHPPIFNFPIGSFLHTPSQSAHSGAFGGPYVSSMPFVPSSKPDSSDAFGGPYVSSMPFVPSSKPDPSGAFGGPYVPSVPSSASTSQYDYLLKPNTMPDVFFRHVASGGIYYRPAYLHYNDTTWKVNCDSCHKPDLIACIGYMKYDLCLTCAEKFLAQDRPAVVSAPSQLGSHIGSNFAPAAPNQRPTPNLAGSCQFSQGQSNDSYGPNGFYGPNGLGKLSTHHWP